MMRLIAVMAITLVCSTQANAQIEVSFIDAAPTDVFEFKNMSACPSGAMELTIDLSASEAGLLFDTAPTGSGVQVYQPLVLTNGAEFLTSIPQVSDGARQITLSVTDLPGQSSIGFTIDVDDTLAQSGNGQTRVSGFEMAGAEVRLSGDAVAEAASFDAAGEAVLALNTCLS